MQKGSTIQLKPDLINEVLIVYFKVKPNCNTDIGSCYHFSDSKMSVAAANTYCDNNGLYLVSVDSMQEFEFIRGLISECMYNTKMRTKFCDCISYKMKKRKVDILVSDKKNTKIVIY